ncbi:hypothetical protein H5410_041443 [Solanum commersonii]|uniref:Uncharacterized protein n=1 Tax=Solanum commersonii TaxID=4109 RepID=A0A9J5XRW5_SOLCO|nr:hypothetical protein H5410_041443 [Solanum commersonii]
MDFVILDYEVDFEVPIILGRPFLPQVCLVDMKRDDEVRLNNGSNSQYQRSMKWYGEALNKIRYHLQSGERSNAKSSTGSGENDQAASSDEATSSKSIPAPSNDDPTPVAGELNRWCVEGQWKIYRDAKMVSEK